MWLQRVMMQIVQELCKRPTLNRTAFDMPTIYIPNPSGKVRNKLFYLHVAFDHLKARFNLMHPLETEDKQ